MGLKVKHWLRGSLALQDDHEEFGLNTVGLKQTRLKLRQNEARQRSRQT